MTDDKTIEAVADVIGDVITPVFADRKEVKIGDIAETAIAKLIEMGWTAPEEMEVDEETLIATGHEGLHKLLNDITPENLHGEKE